MLNVLMMLNVVLSVMQVQFTGRRYRNQARAQLVGIVLRLMLMLL